MNIIHFFKQKTNSINALVCISSIAVIMLSGCQTKEVQPPSVADIRTYTTPVMDASIRNIITFNTCKTLGQPIGNEASVTEDIWRAANAKVMQTADNFSSQHQEDYVSYNNIYYSLQTIQTVQNLRLQVLAKLKLKQRDPRFQKITCRREFKRIEAENLALLAPSAAVANALAKQGSNKLQENHASILQTASHNILASDPDRSYFKIDAQLKPSCPKGLSLLTLKNTWPTESYAAYCQQVPIALIQCDWGKCEQQKSSPYKP